MENWKKALIGGALGTGVVLLLTGKRTAGVIVAGVGAAVLASEYPEKLEQLRDNIPDYADRGMRILENLAQAGERVAEILEKRGRAALREVSSY